MKALSIRQPWPWAILHAGKRVENRCWWTSLRGPVLIHAGKGMTRDEYTDFVDFYEDDIACPRWIDWPAVPAFADLPRGGVVGRATIVDCVTRYDSAYFCGPYGFVLADVWPVPFLPLKGALGFFDVPREVASDEWWREVEAFAHAPTADCRLPTAGGEA